MDNTIPSVLAAMQVVDEQAGHASGLSQATLAKTLGLSPSMTYRFQRSLAVQGWVTKGDDGLHACADFPEPWSPTTGWDKEWANDRRGS